MATVIQIKTAIENWVANHINKFINVENDYYATHGSYWQGSFTPITIPDDGAIVTADYTRHPTDQIDSWLDRFTGVNALPNNIPTQVQVDVYDGPLGKGWSLTTRFTKDGITYSRTWAYGPEQAFLETLWVES